MRIIFSGKRWSILLILPALLVLPRTLAAEDAKWWAHYIERSVGQDTLKWGSAHASPTRQLRTLNGTWLVREPGDDAEFRSVQVPGAYDVPTVLEFKRAFELDSTFANLTLHLVVFGVNNRCKVFLNDEFIISHDAGYVPFSVALPPHSLKKSGLNELKIEIDNRLLPRLSLPLKHHPGISRDYGGIFRDIFILGVPSISVSRMDMQFEFSDDYQVCRVKSRTALRQNDSPGVGASPEDLSFHVELWDTSGNRLLVRSQPQQLTFDRRVITLWNDLEVRQFKLWRPEQPTRYELRAIISAGAELVDVMSRHIGLRELKAGSGRLLLNGAPLQLRGLDWHEDYGNTGPVATPDQIEEMVRAMKATGANAVRVLGTPPHPVFVDACDRSGLLVFVEAPFTLLPRERCTDLAFAEMAANYLRGVVEWYTHYTSVAAWGLGEDWQTHAPAVQNLLQELRRISADLSDRPTYVSYRFLPPARQTGAQNLSFRNLFARSDILLQGAGLVSENRRQILTVGFPLPMLASTNRSNSRRPGSIQNGLSESIEAQERQAYKLNRVLAQFTADTLHADVFIHTLADWPESLPNLNDGPGFNSSEPVNHSGIVDRRGEPRVAHGVVESFFKEGRTKKMAPWAPDSQNPNVYPITGLALILIFLFNFNRSRRLRGNLRRIFLYPHGFYMELKEQRKVSGAHTFLLSVMIAVTLGVILSSIFFKYRESLLFDQLLNLFIDAERSKSAIIWLTWHPGFSIVVMSAVVYLLFGFAIIVLKLSSLLFSHSLAIGRFATMVFWSGASFLWLMPVVPIYYRLISQTQLVFVAFALLALFVLWFAIRWFRAIRAVFMFTFVRTAALVLVLTLVIVGGIAFYYDTNYAIFEYLPVYWKIVELQLPFLPAS